MTILSKGECKPHIFAIADNAYTGMKRNDVNQDSSLKFLLKIIFA
jgi:hypothetical protein